MPARVWRNTLAEEEKVYFISDAHLGEDHHQVEKTKEERLIGFLRHIAQDATFLYVLGDLFDFWFEYKHAVPARHHRILHQLAALVQRGTRTIYVAGNHDFWLGDFLTQEIGMEISGQPMEIEHQGLRLFVAHGDGLASKDRGYRLLKKVLRHPLNIWLYRQIHPDIGLPLAKLFSASSRAHSDQKALKLVLEYEQAARQKLSQGFDAVILGHSHYPILQRFGEKTYLNVGDWITHFTYGVLQGGMLALERWHHIP
jgi:UDP-2,3-diacylglucosamine hydrolase